MTAIPKLFIAAGIFHPEAGGPATYLYEILPELQKSGWDIRALTYGAGSTSAYPYPLKRIARRPLPIRLADYARAAYPRLRWADVVYVHTLDLPLFNHHAPRVAKIVGDQAWERAIRKGWIPPTEDIDVFQTKTYSRVVTAQKTASAKQVQAMDGVIVPSQYLKRMVIGWGVDEAKIHVIYNALPDDPAANVSEASKLSQAQARAELGLNDAPILLTAGRLVQWKGVDSLIAILPRLPDVRLLIAGDGEMMPALIEQVRALELGDRVMFLGKLGRHRLNLYFKAADYLVLYSGYEGLSHTLLESLRAGTPVIASDKGGNPEVVQHGVNGLLVPYKDADALEKALHEAFQTGKRSRLAANTSVGMERFDFKTMVQQTSDVLHSYLRT